jgi:hypothetical protein
MTAESYINSVTNKDVYVYIDESGRDSDEFYVIVAVAFDKPIRVEDMLNPLDRCCKECIKRLIDRRGELKGSDLALVEEGEPPVKAHKDIACNCEGSCLEQLLRNTINQASSVRVAILQNTYIHELVKGLVPKIISEVITETINSNMTRISDTDRITIKLGRIILGNLQYLSVLGIEGLVRGLLNMKVPRNNNNK